MTRKNGKVSKVEEENWKKRFNIEQQLKNKHNIKESFVQLERIHNQPVSFQITLASIKQEYDEDEESLKYREMQQTRPQNTDTIPVKLETIDDIVVYESIDILLPTNRASIKNNDENDTSEGNDRDAGYEFGLVSDIDIVKSEIDEDEVTLNTFREEMRTISYENGERSRSLTKELQTDMTNEQTCKKNYQCQICNRSSTRERNLRVHFNSHIKKKCKKLKTFECHLCKQIFPKLKFLRFGHMKTHLPDKSYDCKYCHSSYSRLRDHQEHVMKNHFLLFKFQCKICHGILEKTRDMYKHQQTCVNPNKRSTMHFKCSLCDSEFPRLTEVRRHIVMAECTNEDIKVKRKQKINIENILKRNELKPVEKVVDGKKMFKCPVCEHTSKEMKRLEKHILIHTKPFQCLHCEKAFATNFHICKHIRARHPNKFLHRCMLCQRWFYEIDTFEEHENRCWKRR